MELSKSVLVAIVTGILSVAPLRAALAQTPDDRTATAGLLPGDIVRLKIWREPDLSGDFSVDQTGVVTFPMLGPMVVTAQSEEALEKRLITLYQEYLRNPSIDVTLMRRVNILGAVRVPGLYPVDPTMTIADAVALAGGATPDGNRREIELMRGGKRIAVKLNDSMRISDLPLRSGDQIFIPERSWISRNPGLLATAVSAGVSLIIAVFLR